MNKKQRLEVYKNALGIYKENAKGKWFFGLCHTINEAQNEIFGKGNSAYGNGMSKFPEIYKQKPKRCGGGYWFPSDTRYGIAKRIWILRQAIKELS